MVSSAPSFRQNASFSSLEAAMTFAPIAFPTSMAEVPTLPQPFDGSVLAAEQRSQGSLSFQGRRLVAQDALEHLPGGGLGQSLEEADLPRRLVSRHVGPTPLGNLLLGDAALGVGLEHHERQR